MRLGSSLSSTRTPRRTTRWSGRSSWACRRCFGGFARGPHRGETGTVRGSKKAVSVGAFLNDCRHEVRPVTAGYRVVLTYSLLLRGGTGASAVEPDPELVGSVAGCLDEHFASPRSPVRVVYLLDHEYTRRGLDWSRLKGADARRVALLGAAAERAGCDIVLALVDVHERWSAFEADGPERWYQRSATAGGTTGTMTSTPTAGTGLTMS